MLLYGINLSLHFHLALSDSSFYKFINLFLLSICS